jgi:hypothetical protein
MTHDAYPTAEGPLSFNETADKINANFDRLLAIGGYDMRNPITSFSLRMGEDDATGELCLYENKPDEETPDALQQGVIIALSVDPKSQRVGMYVVLADAPDANMLIDQYADFSVSRTQALMNGKVVDPNDMDIKTEERYKIITDTLNDMVGARVKHWIGHAEKWSDRGSAGSAVVALSEGPQGPPPRKRRGAEVGKKDD